MKRVGSSVSTKSTAADDARADSAVQVAVRVRPLSHREQQSGTRCIISVNGNQTTVVDPTAFAVGKSAPLDLSLWSRSFAFDYSFWSAGLHDPHYATQVGVLLAKRSKCAAGD